jgi:N-acetylneuraminic acid mutarotase
VYGSLGMPSAGDFPGSREGAATWTDHQGNFWLFGGVGYDSSGSLLSLNDLWKFDPSTKQWTWISGSNLGSRSGVQSGVYGALGAPAAGNVPGSRSYASSWIDAGGNLWLFGGEGYNPNNKYGIFNDLWKFDPSIGMWTWIGGCAAVSGETCEQRGVYGTRGTSSAMNAPGVRSDATSWIDNSGHLWLFGGWGLPASLPAGALNDLWQFDPSTTQWTWMGGSQQSQQPSVGSLGMPASQNSPGDRSGATGWIDTGGNLWLFGGTGVDGQGFTGLFNDLWEFSLSTHQWTWISGSNQSGSTGVYGTIGTPSGANVPGSRIEAGHWIDDSGRLWLFGGKYQDSGQNWHEYNDLWMFDPSVNQWAWMSGSSADPGYQYGWPGIYGVMGTPAPDNSPGGRGGGAYWTDTDGNFWLFGGFGVGQFGPYTLTTSKLNDLWEYEPAAGPTKITPTVTMTLSSSSIDAGRDLVVTVAVNGTSGHPTPTGSAMLAAGNYTSRQAALANGSVTITIPGGSLATGTFTLVATYSGDPYYNGVTATTSITVSPAHAFKLTCSPQALTVTRGVTIGNTSTVTISPVAGFSGTVLLTAGFDSSPANVQQLPSLGFVGNQVNISGSNAGAATLTITTTAPISADLRYPKGPGIFWGVSGGAAVAGILLFGLFKPRRRWQVILEILVLFVALSYSVVGCGSGGSNGGGGGGTTVGGTSVGNYIITIQGTSITGTEKATAEVSLTVQ